MPDFGNVPGFGEMAAALAIAGPVTKVIVDWLKVAWPDSQRFPLIASVPTAFLVLVAMQYVSGELTSQALVSAAVMSFFAASVAVGTHEATKAMAPKRAGADPKADLALDEYTVALPAEDPDKDGGA